MSKNVVYKMKFSPFCKRANLFSDTLGRYSWQSTSSRFGH